MGSEQPRSQVLNTACTPAHTTGAYMYTRLHYYILYTGILLKYIVYA